MSEREVVILSGVRTAIGDYGGSLKDIAPSDLAARVVKEAVARAKVDPKDVGQCVIGNVIHTEPKDMYISRLACVNGGLPHDTGAFTVNRLCGSGMQAIVSASQYILLGETDVAVAGGAESMSRAIYASLTQRWGARMGDSKMMDMMVGALTDPFDTVHMGVTAENVASQVRADARGPGCVRRREPQARRRGHRRRPLQEPDPADRTEEQEGSGRVRHRRACPRRFVDGRNGQAEGRVHQGKRHRDRRQRFGDQRRRLRRRADGEIRRGGQGLEADGAAGRLRPCRHRSRRSWAWDR